MHRKNTSLSRRSALRTVVKRVIQGQNRRFTTVRRTSRCKSDVFLRSKSHPGAPGGRGPGPGAGFGQPRKPSPGRPISYGIWRGLGPITGSPLKAGYEPASEAAPAGAGYHGWLRRGASSRSSPPMGRAGQNCVNVGIVWSFAMPHRSLPSGMDRWPASFRPQPGASKAAASTHEESWGIAHVTWWKPCGCAFT